MAKKKTENKELKPKKVKKEELIEVPKTEYVKIVLTKDGKEYTIGYKLACELVDLKRATLA
jgi:hypothetical protein